MCALPRGRQNVSRPGIEVFATATGEFLAEWAGDLPTFAREGAVGPDGTGALIYQRALYAINTSVPRSPRSSA